MWDGEVGRIIHHIDELQRPGRTHMYSEGPLTMWAGSGHSGRIRTRGIIVSLTGFDQPIK